MPKPLDINDCTREDASPTPASPWKTAAEAGAYIRRSKRFVLREVRAGRLRAAQVGGRGQVLTRVEWLDEYLTAQATPIAFTPRRRA